MAVMETLVSQLSSTYPGRHDIIYQLETLLTTTTPPCIHVHAPFSPKPAASLIRSVLDITHTKYASIHGVECLNQRLFFDRVLQLLSGWCVRWSEGCEAFGAGKYSGDMSGFLEGLRVIARDSDREHGDKMVLLIERVERLKENLPELMVPLTRMAELSGLAFTTIFVSEASWFELRPPYGAAIDPFLIQVSHLSSQDAISTLMAHFPSYNTAPSIHRYSPHLKPLYAHYASALYSVCSPFLVDEYELLYIAAACWPSFVSPVLADWRARSAAATSSTSINTNEHPSNSSAAETTTPCPAAPHFPLPSEETRMRLVRYFTPFFTRALEALYPRTQHATQWLHQNAPPPDLQLSELMTHARAHADNKETFRHRDRDRTDKDQHGETDLTTVAKYVLVASFLASFNPAKTDARLIGRAPDERGKRRRGGGPRRARGGGRVKVPQRLLGPAAFPLDRMLAILGSLMEEHDEDVERLRSAHNEDEEEEDYEKEKDTEMAVGRVHVSATISELVAMRLLHRTTSPDRLDGPPMFKCGISQGRAFELARAVGVGSLVDFMWDVS